MIVVEKSNGTRIRTLKWIRGFGNRVWSDTNTNTDNDTGYALHGSSTSADAYGPSPDDDGYNPRRGQDPRNNNEDIFDDSRLIQLCLLRAGLGVGYVNINGQGHIPLSSRSSRTVVTGLVHRISSRSRSVGGQGKRTMNERIASGGDGEEGRRNRKHEDEEREDRDRKRVRSIDRDEDQEVNKEKDDEDEEEKDSGNTGHRQQPSTLFNPDLDFDIGNNYDDYNDYNDTKDLERCSVCRAPIPGWDEKGGGAAGLAVEVAATVQGRAQR
ncbi:hypothetical protein GGU11DRAFT_759580 [Lentinula aff. detonsa]|nr:hypothetical protein GGU11DRAFT_759580 [Lentinula aff. detonsa]